MLRRVGAFVVLFAASATHLAAADLPQVMAGQGNTVPQCVTPGRLMAYLKMRNPEINPRYDAIATQYMRVGEELGVRWDYAFYQMIVETGALSYWRGNRHGDVKPEQNNFAGLGATGGGERGESFKDIERGVRAHLEHVLLYAGRPVANPVAERTRKVREWGILTGWQQSLRRPMTYTDLASRWAPGNRAYVGMMQAVAERFHAEVCRAPDPRPQLVQEARAPIGQGGDPGSRETAATGGATAPAGAEAAKTADAAPSVLALGAELIQRVFEPKAERDQGRSALGASPSAERASADPAAPSVPYKSMNPPPASQEEAAPANAAPVVNAAATDNTAPPNVPAGTPPGRSVGPTIGTKSIAAPATPTPRAGAGDKPTDRAGSEKARFALAGTAATAAAKAKPLPDTALPPAANQKCRVWTASYGGQKSVIIRSVVDQVVNFTVLDVNSGQETREADAFISAYAKNGKIAGEYPNQAQALDKAFELCPEG